MRPSHSKDAPLRDPHGRDVTDLARRAFLEATSAALATAAAATTARAHAPAAPPARAPVHATGGRVEFVTGVP